MAAKTTVHTVRRPRLEKLVSHSLGCLERLSPAMAGRLAFQLFLTPIRNYFPVCPQEEAVLERAESRLLRYGRYRRHYLQTFLWHPPAPAETRGHGPSGSGNGDAGAQSAPTILLLHGWMASASHMSAFVQPLLEDGFRVVALDAPAHGRSSGFQSSMPEFAEAICRLVQELGPVDGIIAHSFGGASSLFLLHYQPSAIAINSLVTLASPNQVERMMQIIVQGLGGSDRLRQEMEKCFLKRYGNPVEHYAIENMVADNPLPGLVIHDRDDPLVNFSEGEAIAQAWPNAQLLATEGLGHGGILRDPAIIQQVVEFKRRHCRAPASPAASMPSAATPFISQLSQSTQAQFGKWVQTLKAARLQR
jgi:pimeloyl-ACP methyl ester carboxylesterase